MLYNYFSKPIRFLNKFDWAVARFNNKEANIEQPSSVPTQNSFFPEQKVIEDSITNYKNIPTKYCINERYYLINKCNLIKDTFIMTLNKKTSIYGSIGYFNKKQETNYSK